jgi:hypothetical protein
MSDRTRQPTQVDRVLSLLRARAAECRPLNTVDLLAPAADGGKPIIRLPARINDLRDSGHVIDTRRAANRTADYFLISEPRRVEASPKHEPTAAEPVRLFDPGRFRGRLPRWEAV